ncbi:MAG: hypothetical protein M3P49_17090 [Actinomycetota bacterium]|nr:hypothetical protein [Actinomycetota bacterium]
MIESRVVGSNVSEADKGYLHCETKLHDILCSIEMSKEDLERILRHELPLVARALREAGVDPDEGVFDDMYNELYLILDAQERVRKGMDRFSGHLAKEKARLGLV